MEPSMGLVTASKVQFKPHTMLGNHVHGKPYFCAILKGSYAGKYGSKHQEGHPAETVFRPAGETHRVRFHNVETHILVIEFTPSLLEHAAEHCPGLEVSSNFSGGKLTRLAKRLWAEYRLGDSSSRLSVEGLLLEMLVLVSREHRPAVERVRVPPWLLRVREQIEGTCAQGLSVGALAETADVHPVYLVTACLFPRLPWRQVSLTRVISRESSNTLPASRQTNSARITTTQSNF